MCYWTYVNLPRADHHFRSGGTDVLPYHNRAHEAQRHVEDIILTAFPSFESRSDPMSDYSDFVFMVN
jgi:hypothetical protein